MAKVLLVEDDNNLREIYEARMQAEGYQVVTAMDGEEALVIAKKETPDLIIADVMMPRISGFEMLDILRNTEGLKEVKIIMLTALGQAEDKTRADSLGADRYLVKSQVTLEDIVKAASDVLGGGEATPAEAAPAAPVVAAEMPMVAAPAVEAPAPTEAAVAPITPEIPTIPEAPAPTPEVSPDVTAETTPEPTTPTAPEPTAIPVETTAPAEAAPELSPITEPTPATPAADATTPTVQDNTLVDTTPPTAPVDTNAQAVAANDDALMANAVNNLISDTSSAPASASGIPVEAPTINPPAAAQEPTTVAEIIAPTLTSQPTAGVPDDDSVTIAHKKIISPMEQTEANTPPDLRALLAKEGISTMDDAEANGPPSAGGMISNNPAQQMHADGSTVPHQPGHIITPAIPAPTEDNNGIAL